MRLHGPSVAAGSAATAAVALAALAAMAGTHEPELALSGAPGAGGGPVPPGALLSNAPPPLGDPGAPVTLVEFGDYQCFYCSRFFHETEGAIVESYVDTGKVRMVFKDYTIIGQDSVGAAHAARCAAEQGLFWEYHDALYGAWDGENTGWASPDGLASIAAGAGLDAGPWAECMADGRHMAAIEASNGDAAALGLTGTPAFFVIGPGGHAERISGAQPYAAFEAAIEAALAG